MPISTPCAGFRGGILGNSSGLGRQPSRGRRPHREALSAPAESRNIAAYSETANIWLYLRSCLALSNSACAPLGGSAALRAPPSLTDHAAHFAEVQNHFAAFRALEVHGYARFAGPWIENAWISRFGSEDAAFWYPIVPLLGQWTDAAFGPSLYRDAGLREQLDSAARSFFFVDEGGGDGINSSSVRARRDMIYLTVVQHDDGVPWRSITECEAYRNVFILGVSSWGSAALPYIFLAPPPEAPKPARRSLATSFVGTLNVYRRRLPGLLANSSLPAASWRITQASREELFRISADSLFALAPRSYGRTSIRLTELMNSGGVVVLYVYDDDDVAWMPYADRADVWGVDGAAFAVRWRELHAFFCAACELLGSVSSQRWSQLMAATGKDAARGCACPESRWSSLFDGGGVAVPATSTLAGMERRARSIGPALFSPDGVLEQIRWFVKGPAYGEGSSALGCVPKPETLRVPWQHDWDTTAYLDNFDAELPVFARKL